MPPMPASTTKVIRGQLWTSSIGDPAMEFDAATGSSVRWWA